MIIFFLFIFLCLLIYGSFQLVSDHPTKGSVSFPLGLFGSIASFIVFLVILCKVLSLNTIDSKIEMYEEDNLRIENYISELQSETVDSKYFEVYISNNAKIKSLKLDKFNGDIYRFLLYFG